MKILRFYIKFVNALNERIGFLVSWLTTAMVAVVCYDVFTRYLLKQSSVAVQELEWHLFAVIFLLGAAYTLKHDRHVRVDVIYMRLSERQRAWINLLGTLLFLIPFSLLIIWSSKNFVVNSFLFGESSPNPGGLPARYLLKACIPLGFILVLLQALSLASSSLMVIVGRDDA
ncbi:MAG: TRAP transporter small permease subunit [Deltaproteobacteria bacterium]|nr:TRAP transporter small permease subunit [Deltaproteobacteria bacterium]